MFELMDGLIAFIKVFPLWVILTILLLKLIKYKRKNDFRLITKFCIWIIILSFATINWFWAKHESNPVSDYIKAIIYKSKYEK